MMEEYPTVPRRMGASAESTLLTLAMLALVVVLLSTVTLVPRGSQLAGSGVNAGGGGTSFAAGGGVALAAGAVLLAAAAGGGAGGVGGVGSVGGGVGGASRSVSGSAGGGARAGTTAGGSTTGAAATRSGSTAGGSTAGGTAGGSTSGGGTNVASAPGIDCRTGRNGGATDTGVTANSIVIGAVTVDSGPGASFLQPEDIAMQAVVRKVNASGGICGRQITLKLRDSGWDATTGARYIQNLVEGDRVFILAVNPDSEGLDSSTRYITDKRVPVVGTDGLLYSQYQNPYIWPIASSTVTAMHAMAQSQAASGKRNFSLVYETTYRFGREGANAYNNAVKRATGANIPGYSDPSSSPQCLRRFCGIVANQQGYGSQANSINSACGSAPACDAGAVLLEPTTAITWFSSGGRFGGVSTPGGGAGAAPQPLFARYLADGCQRVCNQMRLWTGFLPPIEQFAGQPGVQTYVNDMKAFSSSVDVNNQFAEGAYLGMRLTVDMLTKASNTGLTRASIATLLDSTTNYDIGLTIRPLSWSAGNHFALTTVHAFDESYPAGFGGWQYVQGSVTTDPDPKHI